MNWFGTITLKAGCRISCPLPYDGRCMNEFHEFLVEQTAQTPLLLETEKAIREKLQSQLDLIVAKFLEAHK